MDYKSVQFAIAIYVKKLLTDYPKKDVEAVLKLCSPYGKKHAYVQGVMKKASAYTEVR